MICCCSSRCFSNSSRSLSAFCSFFFKASASSGLPSLSFTSVSFLSLSLSEVSFLTSAAPGSLSLGFSPTSSCFSLLLSSGGTGSIGSTRLSSFSPFFSTSLTSVSSFTPGFFSASIRGCLASSITGRLRLGKGACCCTGST